MRGLIIFVNVWKTCLWGIVLWLMQDVGSYYFFFFAACIGLVLINYKTEVLFFFPL